MNFNRTDIADSVLALARSSEVNERCVGLNYLIEENVSPERGNDVESFGSGMSDVRELVDSYFRASVQGLAREHLSSTFDEALNAAALLSLDIEPNQKIVRLERIDGIIGKEKLDFSRLQSALASRNQHGLSALSDLFLTYPGARPSFAAFKSEIEGDLGKTDWLQRVIDRLGLIHHYPFDSRHTYSFALMEYTAKEVIAQARKTSIARCFAIATVIECQQNPAFFPVPSGSKHGFTVDLRDRMPASPAVREILHVRFDYSWNHISRLERWTGADAPDIEAARARHLTTLRSETGRSDFGDVAP